MAEWTQAEAQKAIAEVARRSRIDPEFRKLALRDPNAAIAQINPTPLPPGFTVRAVENEGASLTLVLPDPVSKDDELSDTQLEHVAGGFVRGNLTLGHPGCL